MAKKKRRVARGSNRSSPTKTNSQTRPTSSFSHVGEVLALSFLAILVLLIYSNNLRGPFIFDDWSHIPKNPHIRLERLTLEGIERAAFESPDKNRPVANISFALNYYFHQYNVVGYHLVNILIHVTTGILLYFFAKTTLSLPSLRSSYAPYGWIAFSTALIWVIHPIQTQSVSYIVQRMNNLAAMFYVSSFLLYARARLADEKTKKWVLFAGCTVAGILSLGSKENTATLPFFIFLYEWYFFQDLSWSWLKRHFFVFAGIFVLFAIVASLYLGANPLERILGSYGSRNFTLTQRVLTEFRVVIFYISLLIFPHPSRLNLDHDFPFSYSLLDPLTTLLAMAAIGGLIVMAFHMAKKERLLSFCILWFLGNLVIESSVIGLEITYEHRNYLPSMLVSLLTVTLAFRHFKAKWLGVGVTFLVVGMFSVWTYERNRIWNDDVTFWRDCVEKSPKKARPHNNLAASLAMRGKTDEAIDHYSKALYINPNYAKAHNNLGVALDRQGRLKEAMSHYEEALRIKPDYVEAHINLGAVLDGQGRLKEAMSHFSEALRIKPDDEEARRNLERGSRLMGKSLGRRKQPYYPGDSRYHTSIAE